MKRARLLFLCFLQFSCSGQVKEKFNGVSYVASRENAAQEHVDELIGLNASYAAVMPYGFIREKNSPPYYF